MSSKPDKAEMDTMLHAMKTMPPPTISVPPMGELSEESFRRDIVARFRGAAFAPMFPNPRRFIVYDTTS